MKKSIFFMMYSKSIFEWPANQLYNLQSKYKSRKVKLFSCESGNRWTDRQTDGQMLPGTLYPCSAKLGIQ